MNEPTKVFRDSVHGYIQVPSKWCKLFIDTPIFQRLRCIEQTSMRCLYPSARHDRFIHSLGTYYLGDRAISQLLSNCADIVPRTLDKEQLKTTFRIACLMHDCAHAPFSHTFESYFRVTRDPQPNVHSFDQLLFDLMMNDHTIKDDFHEKTMAPHEQASAIVMLKHFREAIMDVGGDPELAARMIMGCTYQKHDDDNTRFKNVVISLLNGSAVDVDKLDYITRDTWASGVDNVHIDLDRLLSSLTMVVKNSQYVLAFKPNALSVIQGVVDARNFLYRWIFTHHKVLYTQYILQRAVKETIKQLTDSSEEDDNLIQLISVDSFEKSINIGQFDFYLVSDSDLIYVMKCFQDKVPEAKEWLTHKYSRKSVWKSLAEFRRIFSDQSANDMHCLLSKLLKKKILQDFQGYSFLTLEAKIKDIRIEPNEVIFDLGNDGWISFDKIISGEKSDMMPLFYIYQDINCPIPRNDLVSYLKSQI